MSNFVRISSQKPEGERKEKYVCSCALFPAVEVFHALAGKVTVIFARCDVREYTFY